MLENLKSLDSVLAVTKSVVVGKIEIHNISGRNLSIQHNGNLPGRVDKHQKNGLSERGKGRVGIEDAEFGDVGEDGSPKLVPHQPLTLKLQAQLIGQERGDIQQHSNDERREQLHRLHLLIDPPVFFLFDGANLPPHF